MMTFGKHSAAGLLALAMTTAPVLATDVHYSCSGGTRVIATFSPPGATPGSVVLVFVGSDTRLTLPQVRSADGGRYANNETEFWIKGREATLTRSGRSEQCQSR
jgi:membrane-bound inhibitor of C-type lysozyme